MTDPVDPAGYGGRVLFPRSADDLRSSTRCPACFTALTSMTCSRCGLDLSHPAAAELAAISMSAADALDARLAVIGRIRHQAAGAPAAIPPVLVEQPVARPVVTSVVAPIPRLAERPPRGRSGVQMTLLAVGVTLLSIAAAFFLVYAFIAFGAVWRSVIIGAVTVAAVVGASLLRRRLTATAEGIAAFGVVLVHLDVHSIRANDVLGAGRVDAAVYWGAALLVMSALLGTWNRLTGLRTASVAASIAIVPGAAALAYGLTDDVADAATSLTVSFAAACAVALVHPLSTRGSSSGRTERGIVLGAASMSWFVAAIGALFLDPHRAWSSTAALGALAALAAVHAALASRSHVPVAAAWAFGWTAAAAIGASAAVGVGAVHENLGPWTLLLPAVAAGLVATFFDVLRSRSTGTVRQHALVATALSAVVAAIAVVPAVGAVVTLAVRTAILRDGTTGPLDALPGVDEHTAVAFAALAATVALATATSVAARAVTVRLPALVGSAALLAVVAPPLAGTVATAVAAWFLVSAAALALLRVAGRAQWRSSTRTVLAIVAVLSATGGYSLGWSLDVAWGASVAAFISLALAARRVAGTPARAAALAGLATLVALVAAYRLGAASAPGAAIAIGSLLVSTSAALLLAGSAVPRLPRLPLSSRLDRRVVFWITVPVAVVGGALPAFGVLPESPELRGEALGLAGALLLVGALVPVSMAPTTASYRFERHAASLALAPAALLATQNLARFVDARLVDDDRSGVPAIAAALLVAAGALMIELCRPESRMRRFRDAGAALVGVPAIALALGGEAPLRWLVLVLAGSAALLLAISRDGLVGSRSPRRHLGWLALVLATGGLWVRLGDAGVTAIEAFVLPLGAALLVTAGLVAVRSRNRFAAPSLVLAALVIATLPIAVSAASGPPARAIVIAAAAAVLLLGGSLVRAPRAARTYLDAAAGAGVTALLAVTIGRVASADRAAAEPDAWTAVVVVVLATAAFGQASVVRPGRIGALAGPIVGIAAMAALTGLELAGFDDPRLGPIRAIAVVVVLSAVHLIGVVVDSPVLARPMAWSAVGLAAASAAVGTLEGALDPLEMGTLPLAIALLASGCVALSRSATRGSWSTLAPGLVVLIVPSFSATLVDRPIWRLVGVGVVAVAAIAVGSILRLQAPFVIGTIVTLWHAIATFAPQIRAAYEFTHWWVWAGVGGTLLVALAARYEHRLRDVRTAVDRIGALR